MNASPRRHYHLTGVPFLASWVVGSILIAAVMPVGLIALVSFASNGSGSAASSTATSHGELFLGAGNAVAASVVTLLGSTRARSAAMSLAMVTVCLVAIAPLYAIWAVISVRALSGEDYDANFATTGGWIAAAMAAVLSFWLVAVATSTVRWDQ